MAYLANLAKNPIISLYIKSMGNKDPTKRFRPDHPAEFTQQNQFNFNFFDYGQNLLLEIARTDFSYN